MCDTALATPDRTAEHVMLFGKNSDRQRNEAQNVEYFSAIDHPPDASLKCTYIAIPQARRTQALLLCRPFWIWGAEMGANECGVVIGNEGLHARIPAPTQEALIGMDLLRLGLERACTAAEAVDVITRLLQEYGQGGNCGHLTPNYYHNGFMIADADEAFVLETVAREWICQRVRTGVRAISNGYSIDSGVDRVSSGLTELMRASGLGDGAASNYADAIGAENLEHIGFARGRRERSELLLGGRRGVITAADMMSVLRDHGADSADASWNPWQARRRTLCMHAGEQERPAQTTNAMVSEIRPGSALHWVTATAAPCLSIFKPVLLDVEVPAHGPRAGDRFDPRALWWRHERLHRASMLGDFSATLCQIRPERDALEAQFRSRMRAVMDGASRAERARAVADCWKEAIATEDRWLARACEGNPPGDAAYIAGWRALNEIAGIPIPAST